MNPESCGFTSFWSKFFSKFEPADSPCKIFRAGSVWKSNFELGHCPEMNFYAILVCKRFDSLEVWKFLKFWLFIEIWLNLTLILTLINKGTLNAVLLYIWCILVKEFLKNLKILLKIWSKPQYSASLEIFDKFLKFWKVYLKFQSLNSTKLLIKCT